jgi:hypothetical protein
VTNIIVESGQTVVLGGLFVEDTTVGRSQVPVLGDIPLIGSAFKGQDDDFRRSEVIFMVKTTVMDHADLAVLGEKAEERTLDARIAIRNGLLPFSNDKLVSAHLLDARRHYEAGDTGKAMWSVNLALHLAPTSEDAIALKELIKGEPREYADQTFFGRLSDDIINDEVELLPNPDLPAEDLGPKPEMSSAPESTFVLPVAGFPTPADNADANRSTVETVDELTVEGSETAAADREPFAPELIVEVDTLGPGE